MDKSLIRQELRKILEKEPDKDAKSRLIISQLLGIPEFRQAKILMTYLNTADEVRTAEYLARFAEGGKQLAVPYCEGEKIGLLLYHMRSELRPGAYGILEPAPELRCLENRRIDPQTLDLVLVPGLGFDASGRRLGRGKGYYDRFLSSLPEETLLIGFAFECQLQHQIPQEPHDVLMDMVITEKNIYRRRH